MNISLHITKTFINIFLVQTASQQIDRSEIFLLLSPVLNMSELQVAGLCLSGHLMYIYVLNASELTT